MVKAMDDEKNFNTVKNLVRDFSKVYPNVKNDNETIAIWGKRLKRFDIKSIESAKEIILDNHSGYVYPNDLISLIKASTKETYKFEKKEIIPAENIKERINKLLEKVSD